MAAVATLMDTARGAYIRSPHFLRRSLAPLLSLAPGQLKFGPNYRMWRGRIARAAIDPAYANAQQLGSLRTLVEKAYAGSSFYRELIEQTFGPNFDGNIDLAGISRLPVLRKNDLRAAGDRALAVPRWQVDVGDTSGSNAERPFSFYLDKDRSAREMAFVYEAWSHVGYTESDARACLRGFGLTSSGDRLHEWDPALKELRLSVFPMTREDVSLYVDLIDQRAIRYLYGYPSSVELMCRHMKALGRSPKLPIKGVLLISEPVHDHQRQTISAVLGDVPVSCFYGLSEKVLFASELPGQPGVYEFNPLYGLAELLDEDGQPVTQIGEEGRIIGTGFLSTGMPFIRYDTCDFAKLVQLPTPENGQHMRISCVRPRRKPDFLVSSEGNRVVTIDFTPDNPRFFKGVEEYQFYQEAPGDVLIRYIPSRDGTPDDAERLRLDLEKRARGRLRFSTSQVTQIAAGRGGKRAFIDQQLDMSKY